LGHAGRGSHQASQAQNGSFEMHGFGRGGLGWMEFNPNANHYQQDLREKWLHGIIMKKTGCVASDRAGT
jgi:hypothetical protein